MQDNQPVNEDMQTNRNVLALYSHPQHHELIKINRYLLYLVMGLMLLVMLLGFLLWPTEDPINSFKPRQISTIHDNSAISAEITTLKGQVVGLVSGSIESKLRILEESLREGSVNTAIGTIQDLKRDVRVLQSYTEPSQVQTPEKLQEAAILKEVSHLKHLIYLTLASASLMFAAVAGIWIKKRYRLSFRNSLFLKNQK